MLTVEQAKEAVAAVTSRPIKSVRVRGIYCDVRLDSSTPGHPYPGEFGSIRVNLETGETQKNPPFPFFPGESLDGYPEWYVKSVEEFNPFG